MPEVLMPRLSDTMEEGTLSQWVKHEGDQVRKGDILAVIETDKAAMEMEAYDEGVLTGILVEEGSSVPIGTPIAVIGDQATPEFPPLSPRQRPPLSLRQHPPLSPQHGHLSRLPDPPATHPPLQASHLALRRSRRLGHRRRWGVHRSPASSPASTAST